MFLTDDQIQAFIDEVHVILYEDKISTMKSVVDCALHRAGLPSRREIKQDLLAIAEQERTYALNHLRNRS